MNRALGLRKLLRYASVSVIATLTSLTVLGIGVGFFNAPAGWANVCATAIGTIPSFELNRRWVWGRTGDRSMSSEVVPFAALSVAELLISTFTVHMASVWATGAPALQHTLVVEAASVATFGSLWVVQFVLCDRVLFGRRLLASPAGQAA